MRQAVTVGRQILLSWIDQFRGQNRNSKCGSGIQQKRLCGWRSKTLYLPFQTLRYIRFRNLFPPRYCFRRISKRKCRHSHHRCILIQLLHIHLIKSVRGRMMIAKVEPRILRGTQTGNAELDHTGDILGGYLVRSGENACSNRCQCVRNGREISGSLRRAKETEACWMVAAQVAFQRRYVMSEFAGVFLEICCRATDAELLIHPGDKTDRAFWMDVQ